MAKLWIALLSLGVLLTGGWAPWDVHFFAIPIWLVGIAVYFLPTIIVLVRRKENVLGPILVNVLLGWTFFGWVGALIWACLPED